MDWASYWNDNTYNKASCEGVAPPADIRAYDYSVYTNARRIGAVIQDEIGQAVAGDIVLVGPGTYARASHRRPESRGAGHGRDPVPTSWSSRRPRTERGQRLRPNAQNGFVVKAHGVTIRT